MRKLLLAMFVFAVGCGKPDQVEIETEAGTVTVSEDMPKFDVDEFNRQQSEDL